jgi:G3E family GTPase
MNTAKPLPTNIITGFLGVGKTTAILHLLKHKPENEKWAVLVNEFGEVGIDEKFFAGEFQEKNGVYIREVPGGCMCCVSGLSMQISLNMLLARAKPDRLLIEPTGLGHPKEILALLSNSHYLNILDLRATITLVDARKISQSKYTTNTTFNQQLEVADIIVANKTDLYQANDFNNLTTYLSEKGGLKTANLYSTNYAKLAVDWLNQPSSVAFESKKQHTHAHTQTPLNEDHLTVPKIPECGYLKIDNQGEGFYSIGWLFKADYIFDKSKLFEFLHSIDAERIKAVFSTTQGIFGYNKADDILKEVSLEETLDNRIELIFSGQNSFASVPSRLLDFVVGKHENGVI